MKLWGGRFAKDSDKLLDKFNSSISFDSRLYKHDIIGSIAYAKMLGNKKIISKEDSEIIQKSLAKILSDIENGDLVIDMESEDIHTNIEQILIKRIGDAGKKLHTGRSRNDQVCLDLRMYLKEETLNIKSLLKELGETLIQIAEKNLDTIMPGYTHLQKAQPVTFAHHMMAYFQMFKRDIERLDDCFKRIDVMPLGSGALAGTTYPIDRKMLAEELGFSNITENSMDAVSDRDFVIELSSCISLIIMHLSRLSEEVILWSTHEFNFIELDDAYSTGSSIMPQKKNPDVAELVRGKTGRIYGNLMSLLTTMKSLPLSYNKDMQEDKEAIFDSVDNIKICLEIFSKMLSTMKINREKMDSSAQGGYSNATDVADYLAKNGLPFREAHEITGKLVAYCIKENKAIEELSIEEFKNISPKFENDIYNEIQLKKCISERNIPGGPSKETVETSIKNARSFLENS